MASPGNWLSDTFSSDANENDLLKSRSLNTTRMAAVVAPTLAGIWTAIGEFTDKPPFDDSGFQRQLILAFIALIAVVSVADIIGRAVAAAKSLAPVATILPKPVPATKDANPDIKGKVVAVRATAKDAPAASSEFLFVADSDSSVSWEPGSKIDIT